MKSSSICCVATAFLSILSLGLGEEGGDAPDRHSFLLPFTGNLGNSTVILSHQDLGQELDNNPLDNLSDLRDIHQFDIDLTNYTDHEAVESDIEVPAFNDHFDIDFDESSEGMDEKCFTLLENLRKKITAD